MAKLTPKMPEDFYQKISKLGKRTEDIIGRVLAAGGEVVEAKVRSNLQAVIGQGTKEPSRSTGELLAALGTSPVKIDRQGNSNVKIGFAEPRREQNPAQGRGSYQERTNAIIANVLEYGKSGQTPKPFLKRAKNSSRSKSLEVMKAIFDEEVAKL